MDKAKLKVLQELPYVIQQTCSNCCFSTFPSEDDWGTCMKFQYSHEKHSEELRDLSINKSGHCPDYLMDKVKQHQLGGFAAFLKEDPP